MAAEPTVEALVRRAYPALGTGDEATLLALLDPAFVGRLAEGMPLGLGGVRDGARAMIEDGWWAVGRAFAVRAEPEQWIACADGRLLVLGAYRGRHRTSGGRVEAAFAHLWSARGGRLVELVQLTDTARWAAAVDG
ncbi:nuclear transport factor 2 family protein [Patulibacter defluvii]|uniref:nuclear transport factor 2 family protein n=1 Tax=Patulibacter defluvii TaxID=3095358 RepID=UPI002A75C17A|nr:nuclear transport factor 2 family protein [Patulibacter sp. DM4]